MSTLALAGLPMLQADNTRNIVATQSFVKKLDIGLFFKNMNELGELLRNKLLMQQLRNNVWQQRHLFTFDNHVNELVQFFRKVIEQHEIRQAKESKIIPMVVKVNDNKQATSREG